MAYNNISSSKPSNIPDGKRLLPFHSILLVRKAVRSRDAHCIDGTTCALLCAAACEAFLNDIEGHYSFFVKADRSFQLGDKMFVQRVTEKDVLFHSKLNDLEQSPTYEKYKEVYKHLKGQSFGNSARYQALFNLVKIRNDIVHLKADELALDERDNIEDSSLPASVMKVKKKIDKTLFRHSWIDVLDTKNFCDWCIESTSLIIDEIVRALVSDDDYGDENRNMSVQQFVGVQYRGQNGGI